MVIEAIPCTFRRCLNLLGVNANAISSWNYYKMPICIVTDPPRSTDSHVATFSCVATLNYVGNSIFDSFCPFGTSPVLTKPDKFNKVPAKPSATPPRLFDCLIIDEAGQCIEIDNYIPLRLGMNRIVLVGDPEQL